MSIIKEAKKEVQRLLASGQKLQAVEYLASTFQISQEEAKILVEAVERVQETSSTEGSTSLSTALTSDLKTEVIQLLAANKKMEAIRQVRAQTGAQLKTALELVEEVEKEINPNFKRAGGCAAGGFKIISIFLFVVSFLLLGGAGLTYYYEEDSIKKSDLVIGTIVSLEPNKDSDGAETYAPVVSYEWNGQKKPIEVQCTVIPRHTM